MTKKHFEAMADYLAEAKRTQALGPGYEPGTATNGEMEAVYSFALYLCNKFGERFDRARFDAWIERKGKQKAARAGAARS